jgi:Helix-turn-helix domain
MTARTNQPGPRGVGTTSRMLYDCRNDDDQLATVTSGPRPSPAAGGRIPSLWTLQEASDRVRLSPWALRRAISRGELVASKPAGRIRITEHALDDWLELTRVKPEAEPTQKSLRLLTTPPSRPAQEDSFRARLRRNAS